MSMIEIEESAISAIRNDLRVLRDKVDRMESMMESMIEIYTDTFFTVKEEYVKELKKIKSDGEFIQFSDFEDVRRSIEES
jgi:hypothetical protein